MTSRTTWKPHPEPGALTTSERNDLPDTVFAFASQRKLPLTDAAHVRNAAARFDQVEGVTDAERDVAFANLRKAAKHYEVELAEQSWHDFGRHPHTRNPAT